MEEPIRKKIIKKKVESSNPLTQPSEYIKLFKDDDKHKDENNAIKQAYFESIHNLLWNAAGLNADKAMEHMNLFFAYRLIEPQLEKIGEFPIECKWSYISSLTSVSDIYNSIKKGYDAFVKNEKTKSFFYFKIEIKKETIVSDMVKQVNRISNEDIYETDILGAIFEYMIGRGMSTMADEGQYFTHREICKLAFNLCYNIKKNIRRDDRTLCTFADWFCGTGGFASEYVKGVKEIYKENPKDVNWLKDMESVYCIDKNSNSVSNTLLNLLISTGVPFNNKKIIQHDSFHESITRGAGAVFDGLTIDYCFMNPPYGGDKTKGKEYKFKYSNGKKGADKKFLVNADIQTIGIEDDDKVSAGVQLGMSTLSKDGVCALVLPQGFFFGASKKCIELRKKLIEEYNVHYVVDIPSGAFTNTSTKTSMIVFQAGKQTENIQFIDANQKELSKVNIENLREKNYSLNFKQYIQQDDKPIEGFEMVKLGDVASFIKDKSTKEKSSYLYIDIGSVDKGKLKIEESIKKENLPGRAQYNVKVGDILIGTVRPNLEHYLLITSELYRDNFIVSNGFSIIRCDTNKILPTYLYSIISLPTTTYYLAERATGTTYPVIDDNIIGDLQIPLPSIEKQQEIVEQIDGWTQLLHHEETSLKILEKQMMNCVKMMGYGKERVKLGDIATFKRGKMITKKELVEGDYPVIGGGTKPIGTHNEYNRTEYTILISQSGTAGHISRYTSRVWASDCFSIESDKMINDYLYYSLLNIQEDINFLKVGTAQPHIYPSTIEHLTIPLPTLEEQQYLQPEFDEIKHKHSKIAYYKAKAQEAIERLIPGAKKD